MKRPETIRYTEVRKLLDGGKSKWAIAQHFDVHYTTIKKCVDKKSDVNPRPNRKRNGHNDLGHVNRALSVATGDAVRLQTKVEQLVKELRRTNVRELSIDLGAGTAQLTYHTTKTIKVSK